MGNEWEAASNRLAGKAAPAVAEAHTGEARKAEEVRTVAARKAGEVHMAVDSHVARNPTQISFGSYSASSRNSSIEDLNGFPAISFAHLKLHCPI